MPRALQDRDSAWRVERLDLSDAETALQVLQVQRCAYRVEAELIGFDGIPPLHESYEELVASSLTFMGIRCGGIAAAIAFELEGDRCDIDRLVVMPEHFAKGMASALVTRLLHHPRITVSTPSANTPARRLYEKHGFQVVGERLVAPGLNATLYERHRAGRPRDDEDRPAPNGAGGRRGTRMHCGMRSDRRMAQTRKRLEELLKLSREERSQLAEALLESLADDAAEPGAEGAWAEEIVRRIERGAPGVPSDRVFSEGRARLGSGG